MEARGGSESCSIHINANMEAALGEFVHRTIGLRFDAKGTTAGLDPYLA